MRNCRQSVALDNTIVKASSCERKYLTIDRSSNELLAGTHLPWNSGQLPNTKASPR